MFQWWPKIQKRWHHCWWEMVVLVAAPQRGTRHVGWKCQVPHGGNRREGIWRRRNSEGWHFCFMTFSKLRPPRGKHHSVDKQGVLAVSGALGSSHISGDDLCFEGTSFQSRRQMCPQTLCPDKGLPRAVGKEERGQHLRMLSSGPSFLFLSRFLASPNYLFAARKHFLLRNRCAEMLWI